MSGEGGAGEDEDEEEGASRDPGLEPPARPSPIPARDIQDAAS